MSSETVTTTPPGWRYEGTPVSTQARLLDVDSVSDSLHAATPGSRTCTTSAPVSMNTHESPTFAQTSSQPTSATTDAVVPDSCVMKVKDQVLSKAAVNGDGACVHGDQFCVTLSATEIKIVELWRCDKNLRQLCHTPDRM